ncbi:MAG: restriction endonuclease [Spirochaetes bacterium GWF1_41_5]|nr:MAG: restriction endonuclease [Spirochaetes bacterium GWF1_41_5]HBE02119.1 restriction endonuclease [Spirochaetia bacterium]
MNKWTKLSIEYANQKSYLDDLFHVYPTIPDGIREINNKIWGNAQKAFKSKNNKELLSELLKLDLFPIKESYIAYLKRDNTAIERNPKTVNRLCGRLYEMGLDKIYERCSEPKETNRQIGPMFKDWLRNKSLGIDPVDIDTFTSNNKDAVLDASDKAMMDFAKKELNYNRDKGLDLVARFNKKHIIGEAKFLTDMGGHQHTQFDDAIATIEERNVKAIQIAILDGVLYIPGGSKMYKYVSNEYMKHNIMSALVLREFLYQL